jgi:hypothetical protein
VLDVLDSGPSLKTGVFSLHKIHKTVGFWQQKEGNYYVNNCKTIVNKLTTGIA